MIFKTHKEACDYLNCSRGCIGHYLKKGEHNGNKFNKILLEDYK